MKTLEIKNIHLDGNKLTLNLEDFDENQVAASIHDLSGAMRTINLALSGIKEGYKFDDEYAEAKIQSLEYAVSRMGPHVEMILFVLRGVRHHLEK